jgi:CubicO group peptidase (beta-lactamase class C family)
MNKTRIPSFGPTKRVFISLLAIAIALSGCAHKEPAYWPTTEWKRASPESQGMDSNALLKIIKQKDFDAAGLHSLIVIRHGYIVAEAYRYPYTASTRHIINSATKSFTSTALGIAIDEGLVKGVHERVTPFFKDRYAIAPDDKRDALTIEDLLTMRSGMNWNDGAPSGYSFNGLIASDDWTRFALSSPMLLKPGLSFDYNTGNSQILMGILDKATGGKAEAFVRTKLLEPIGIRDATWLKDSTGLVGGGHGLGMTGEDLARLGFLFLNDGRWEKRQLVSEKWIKAAVVPRTVSKIDFNRGYSYAYHWWIMGKNVYSAQGYAGQTLFVFPEKDLIVVTTASLDYRMYQALYDMVLKDIPGAIRSAKAIPENTQASGDLARYTTGLAAEPDIKAIEIPASFRLAKGKKATFEQNDLGVKSFTLIDIGTDTLTFELENEDAKGAVTRVRMVSGTDGRYRKNLQRLPQELSFFGPEPMAVMSRVEDVQDNALSIQATLLGVSMDPILDRIEISGKNIYLTRTNLAFHTAQGATGRFQ